MRDVLLYLTNMAARLVHEGTFPASLPEKTEHTRTARYVNKVRDCSTDTDESSHVPGPDCL